MLGCNLVRSKSACQVARAGFCNLALVLLRRRFLLILKLSFAFPFLRIWTKRFYWLRSSFWFLWPLWLSVLIRCRIDLRAAFAWQFGTSLLYLVESMCKLYFLWLASFFVFEHWECKTNFRTLVIIFCEEVLFIVLHPLDLRLSRSAVWLNVLRKILET